MFKKNVKLFLGFIIGGLLFGSIGVYATTQYLAKDIKFIPLDSEWNVDNVESAINDIYSNISNSNKSIVNIDDEVTYKNSKFKVTRIYGDIIELVIIPNNSVETITMSGFDGYINGKIKLDTKCREIYSDDAYELDKYSIRNATLEDYENGILPTSDIPCWLATNYIFYDSPFNNCHYHLYFIEKGKTSGFDLRNGYAQIDYSQSYSVLPILSIKSKYIKKVDEKLYIG